MNSNNKKDYVTILSFCLGIVAYIFFGYITIRENRLATGKNLHFYNIYPWNIVILSEWLILLILSFFKNNKIARYFAAFIGNLILITVPVGVTLFSRDYQPLNSLIRVSISGGGWLMMLSSYITLFSVRKDTLLDKTKRVLISNFFIIVLGVLLFSGFFNQLSVLKEFQVKKSKFLFEFFNHLNIAFYTVLIGSVLGISLGVIAYKKNMFKRIILSIVSFFQTIPGLALFGLFIAPLAFLSHKYPFLRDMGIKGIGRAPALIGLSLYALLPMVRNTYEGLKNIDRSILKVGLGMGMSNLQILYKIEIPLSISVILSGLRISTIQAIGNTTLAALIGAGGLGTFVFQGIGQSAPDLIILGAIPIILLSLIADFVLRIAKKLITPKALNKGYNEE